MRDRVAARRYARALFEAAGDPLKRKVAQRDLGALAEVVGAVPELVTSLISPVQPLEQRQRLAGQVGAQLGLGALTRDFLTLLVERKRAALLADVAAIFAELAAAAEGRLQATVVAAGRLAPMQVDRIKRLLKGRTGKDVDIEEQTDPGLLAGFLVRIGDTEIDLSLKSGLDRLQESVRRA